MLTRRSVTLAAVVALALWGVSLLQRPTLNSALRSAVARGDREAVKRLLGEGANPNARGLVRHFEQPPGAPLTMALRKRDLVTAQLLVDAGAALYGPERLVIAAGQGQADVVDFLIRNGVDVNVPDRNGETALAARQSQHAQIVRQLKRCGAR